MLFVEVPTVHVSGPSGDMLVSKDVVPRNELVTFPIWQPVAGQPRTSQPTSCEEAVLASVDTHVNRSRSILTFISQPFLLEDIMAVKEVARKETVGSIGLYSG